MRGPTTTVSGPVQTSRSRYTRSGPDGTTSNKSWTREPGPSKFKTNNYDGLHFYSDERRFAFKTNLPKAYKDTTFLDSDNELQYTVGTLDAFKLEAKKRYRIRMWAMPLGNSSSE